MRKRRSSLFGKLLLLVLFGAGLFLALRQGLIPQRFSPLPPLDLASPQGALGGLIVDWQLAQIRRDESLCRTVMKPPAVEAAGLPDNPLRTGCGWENAVRLARVGELEAGLSPVSCEAAAAFAIWMREDVQPLAQTLFGQPVTAIQDMGTYSCRNIVGNRIWKDLRSEHATANAIDIGGFTLADGRRISVLRDWPRPGVEGQFLRAVHARACKYFRVVLGPDFNVSHNNHFHFDRGPMWTCR